MKATLVSFAVLAASVSAATTTTTTTATACAAQSILDACLDTTEGYLSLCGSQDFSCLCDKYTAIMTCFGNCPNDSRQYSLDSSRQLYCANASAFATKTTTAKTPTSTGATETDASSAGSNEPSQGATETSRGSQETAASSPTPTGGAAGLQRGAGLLAALGVGVAALL